MYLKKLKNILQYNLLLIILIFIVFISFLRINVFPKKSVLNENIDKLVGKVIKIEKYDDKLKLIIKCQEKVLLNYYTEDNISVYLGDTILVKGKMNKPTNNTVPNNFNYKKYLQSLNIFYIMTVDKIEVIKENNNIFYSIKNNLIKRINQFKVSDYLNTFILGNKNYLSDDVYESYQNNGVVHLFCISGTHISLLVSIILFILDKLKVNIKLSYFIVFFLLFFYMFLTSFGASVLRSGVFFILIGLKRLGYLKIDTTNIFYLMVIILLLIDYNLLNNIGFLYSSSITYGLLISKRLIKGNYFKKVLIISFISTLVSLPITINNFYEVNLLGIIYNIFFVPIVSFIVTPLSFLVLIFPFLEIFLEIFVNILEFVSLKLNLIQFNLILPKMNIMIIVIYYILAYLFFKNKNKYIISIMIIILVVKLSVYFDTNYYVYFIDVNQGDSSLIKFRNELILIDTGGIVSFDGSSNYKVSDNTITLIKSLGLKTIDYLILTHGDYDHIGESANVVNNINVKNVIFNKGEYNELEADLINLLKTKNIKYFKNVDNLNYLNSKIYFLNNGEYDNENDNSSVIYVTLGNIKLMLMGDASTLMESDLLKKYNLSDVDILKVGHHGSKTSSSKEFIDKINPKYSIISVGKNNRYNHPNSEVLNNLEKSKIYRTDEDGSIVFKIKNNKLKVKTYVP